MYFSNREDAAYLLLSRLWAYRHVNPLVLGIPQGSVAMAQIIATELLAQMDLLFVRKIPAPGQPELAVAGVGLSGRLCLRSDLSQYLHLPDEYLLSAAQVQTEWLKAKAQAYGFEGLNSSYEGRTVIIVDDGIVTGSTLLTAISEVRAQSPAQLVVAAAVAAPETAEIIRREVDELVVLYEPTFLYSVGQFFENFEDINEGDVLRVLNRERCRPHYQMNDRP